VGVGVGVGWGGVGIGWGGGHEEFCMCECPRCRSLSDNDFQFTADDGMCSATIDRPIASSLDLTDQTTNDTTTLTTRTGQCTQWTNDDLSAISILTYLQSNTNLSCSVMSSVRTVADVYNIGLLFETELSQSRHSSELGCWSHIAEISVIIYWYTQCRLRLLHMCFGSIIVQPK